MSITALFTLLAIVGVLMGGLLIKILIDDRPSKQVTTDTPPTPPETTQPPVATTASDSTQSTQ